MKIAVLLSTTLLLGACATPVPVAPPKMPDLPNALREPCEPLIPIEKKPAGQTYSITDMLKPTIENYRRGVECKIKHQTTVDWYDDQRTIHNSVK